VQKTSLWPVSSIHTGQHDLPARLNEEIANDLAEQTSVKSKTSVDVSIKVKWLSKPDANSICQRPQIL